MLLTRANNVIGIVAVSRGTVSSTVVDPKIIIAAAINSNACGIILCHNHPSGNLAPSQLDIDLTKKLVRAGETLDIKVLDHLIVGENRYYSFADEGLL